MKKNLILLSVLSTALSYSAVRGFVETEGTVSNKLYSGFTASNTKFETKLKGEIRVEDTGFSAGAEIKSEGDKVDNYKFVNKSDSKVWAKYEFPKFYGITASVKAETKLDLNTKFEVEAKTEVSKTEIFGKLTYEAMKVVDSKRKLNGELGFKYKGIEKTELGLKAFGGASFDEKKANAGLEFNAKNTSITATEFKVMVKAEEKLKYEKPSHEEFILTVKPEVKYTGIKDITLEGKLETVLKHKNGNSGQQQQPPQQNNGKFTLDIKPEVSIAYKYKPIDVVTLTPKLTVKGEVPEIEFTQLASKEAKLTIEPELKVEYKPVTGLTLTAKAIAPIVEVKLIKSPTVDINAKGTLAVKYEW